MPFQVGQIVKLTVEKKYGDGTTIPVGSTGSVLAITPGGWLSVQHKDFEKPRLSNPDEFTVVRGEAARRVHRSAAKASVRDGDRVHARNDIGSGDRLIPAGTCGNVTGSTPGGMLIVEFDRGNPRRRLLAPGRVGAGCFGG